MIEVSVTIPTRGDRPTISRTIESVLDSANDYPLDLLIVWSGWRRPPRWASGLPGSPRHVVVPRAGLSLARNAGIQAAIGTVILMPDDDLICEPRWFATMLRALNDGSDIVGGPVRCIWPSGRPSWMSDSMERVFGSFDKGDRPRELRLGESLTGGNIAAKRDRMVALGGYDLGLGAVGRSGGMGEENDLCDRALRRGYRVSYLPDACANQVMEPDAGTRATYIRRMYRFGRAMAVVWGTPGIGRARNLASAAKGVALAASESRLEALGSAAFSIGSASVLGFAGLTRSAIRRGVERADKD